MPVVTGNFKRDTQRGNTSGCVAPVNPALLAFALGGGLIEIGAGAAIAAALPIIAVPALAVGVGVGAAAIRKRMK